MFVYTSAVSDSSPTSYKKTISTFSGPENVNLSNLLRTFLMSLLLTCIANVNICANNAALARPNGCLIFCDSLQGDYSINVYNGRTTFKTLVDQKRKNAVLQFNFDDKAFTTIEILLKNNKSFDFSRNRDNSYIRFKIKGEIGGEQLFIGIADFDPQSDTRTEVKYFSTNYFDITQKWQEITCPLNGFTSEGERWLTKENVGEYKKIDWNKISSIRFSTHKEMNYGRSKNRISTIFIDDLEIITDSSIKQPKRRFTPYSFNPKVINGPIVSTYDSSNVFFTWLDSKLAPKTSVFTYNPPSDFSVFEPENQSESAVLTAFLNDKSWSGIGINRANSGTIDISPWYKTGGMEFYVKGTHGGERFNIGLLDDESDGVDKKVQSKILSSTLLKVSKEWQRVFVPFSSFENVGQWWNSDAHYEVVGTIDWKKISEVRFTIDMYANQKLLQNPNEPVTIHFSNIRFIKKSDVVSNKVFWESFSSTEPDRLIEDFNTYDISKTQKIIDSSSTMEITTQKNPFDNSNAVKMDYEIGEWGSATYNIPSDPQKFNWSLHSAISFDFYSSEPTQTGMIMIVDSGNEAWSSRFIATKGWQTITVPFSKFRQFEWWQPDNVNLNAKMDLNHVKIFDWRPESRKKNGTISIDNIKLTNYVPNIAQKNKIIHINQAGYLPQFHKRFTVTDSNAYTFILKNAENRVLLTDSLRNATFWELSGQYVKQGEFSGISIVGDYTISIQETGETINLSIKDTLNSIFRDAVRMFYFQRASIDIKEPFAQKFQRISGHPDTAAIFHQTTNKTGTANVRGGWYDAGDYGKYIVNGGISCFRLLSLCELYPQIGSDSLKIPESGNGINDILDEVRYELDWFKRMQDIDGGVYFKVAPLKWDGFVMPHESEMPRYIIGKSTTSTLNFSAVMAMASRVFKNIDKKYSRDCIRRAIAAWNWAIKNPSVTQPPENGGSGAYDDAYFDDEFFWAASELFTTTQKPLYKKYVNRYHNPKENITHIDWQNVGLCGYLTLVTHFSNNELDIVSTGNNIIRNLADSIVNVVNKAPFGTPTTMFLWGSNCFVLNHAVICCYAYKQTGKRKYLDAIVDIVNYILGHNATGYSFVTGYGNTSPMQPHHRIMVSDCIDAPYPGFLVGGPNAIKEDEAASEPGVYYPFKQPARSYLDVGTSYASNEVCINWNAVLVFVLGFLEMNK